MLNIYSQVASDGYNVESVKNGSVVFNIRAKSYRSKMSFLKKCESNPEFVLQWLQNSMTEQDLKAVCKDGGPHIKVLVKIKWKFTGK